MIKIQEAIVVEGRYDKNTLAQIVDAPIFETAGFGIFKDSQQLALLRAVAQKRGLIIFTDPDGAGFVIRNYLKSVIPASFLKHAYVPDIMGKERRKSALGKEGKLGVEGMRPDIIVEALRRSGATMVGQDAIRTGTISKSDLAALGLSGGVGSSEKRLLLLRFLGLPSRMSSNAMLQALNILMDLDELQRTVAALEKKNG